MNLPEWEMVLCPECYDKLKIVPNIVRTGSGRCCFGFMYCDECKKRVLGYINVEVSNKNIEHGG